MVDSSILVAESWYSATAVEACVLAHLRADESCAIVRTGHPAAHGQGVEILARCPAGAGGAQRLISVIGWPESGEGNLDLPLRPEVVARGWLANALLDLALARDADSELDLGLALPAVASYIRYLQRLRWMLGAARVSVYLVAQDGRVALTPPSALARPGRAAAGMPGARRQLGLPGATRLQMPLLHALIEAGGSASRASLIPAVARLFPNVPDPPPVEFGHRLSIAQNQLQSEGSTELEARGIWRITPRGRQRHDAEWAGWAEGTED